MSSIAKFNVEKFDRSNDFGLWRVKMRYGCLQESNSALLLCLDNKVLREVNKEDSAAGVWLKLETLYMTKSLANKLYLKKKLFTFYMHSGKKLYEHINEFNKLIGNLANIDVDIDDEDQALMLLTSLQSSYDNFVETLLYGRESLTLEDVLSSLNSRELKKRTDAKDDGDRLYVRGRSDHQDNQGHGSSRSKSKGKGTYKLKCYICYSEDHLKKDCPKKNKKKSTGFVKKNARQGSSMNSEGYLVDGVLLGDNRACAIMGKGMKDGSSFVLENVRYIPELKRNLIYLGTLNREGYTVKLHNGRVKVIKGSLMVLSGTIKGNCVYSLDGWVDSACLHELERRDVLENKGLGIKLKKLRTDNGLEFCNQEFNNLCKESGIARHLTVVGTLQQNGLAERMNMTLLNKVRCLLIQSGFLDSFWAEATVTTSYLINRSPSTALEKKTPMDLWSGHPDNNMMLRIFGCVAYSHVNQGKLKHRAIKSIFLGYPDGMKGYKLWRLDDVKPKIIISKDVVFNESLMYKDTLKGAGTADSGKEVEFKVEHQGSRVEPTVDPHTGENPWNKDKEQDEGPQQQNLNNYVLVRDRAKRTTFIHARYRDESNVSLSRPSGSREAINSSEKDEWVRAMKEEMSSLKKNHTWELVDQPPGQKLVSCKWLYKIKKGIKGVQKPRVILSLTACEDYELEQLDVKTAFLHANLEETIYMRQPPGFEEGTGNKVCLLKKSLYGLKQSPRQWYKRFDVYMINNGFSRSNYDRCVYFKEFALEFDMKELGPARKILGMEIVKDRGSRTLKVSRSGHVQKLLNNYKMDNGKSVSVPLRAHFKVSLKDCPSNELDVEIMSLVYGRDQEKHVDIDGFVDADYAKDPDKDRSIIGYVFMVHGCVVSWKATLHHVVALSTTDAEYMVLTEVVKESIWLKGLLIELGVNLREIVESKEIEVTKIDTKDNAADTFTKVVPGPKFKVLHGDTWCRG
ncbi:retrotransposon protein, putative, ty1-copia subclass [Tanacetum coccineum]